MSKASLIADVVDDIFQSVLASPKRQRRLLSKTFWAKFGFRSRTRDRIISVHSELQRKQLMVNLDRDTFGKESYQDWIVVTYLEPVPTTMTAADSLEHKAIRVPTAAWFAKMEGQTFESEREVEFYFILPLMEQLGFDETDIAAGFRVLMYEGTTRRSKEADCVLFDGEPHIKENALLVIEAKRIGRTLTEDTIGQARSYAMWLPTPFYVVTNGDELRIFQHRGGGLPDVALLSFPRREIRKYWKDVYKLLNKTSIIEHKKRLLETVGNKSR